MNKIISFFTFIGLDYKKEFLKLGIYNGIGLLFSIVLFVIFKITLIFFGILILILGMDYYFYKKYTNIKKDILTSYEDEFVVVISYYQIFSTNNNNVYQSFSLIEKYCSPWMKEKIDILINEIDNDKTVQPFMNFANNFKHEIASNIMVSIYQMVDSGSSNEQMTQFIILFDQLNKNHQKALIERKNRSLDSCSIFPLIGSGMIVVILLFSIISLMGDMLNVI